MPRVEGPVNGAAPDGSVSLAEIRYAHDAEGNRTLSDGADLELDISESSTRE